MKFIIPITIELTPKELSILSNLGKKRMEGDLKSMVKLTEYGLIKFNFPKELLWAESLKCELTKLGELVVELNKRYVNSSMEETTIDLT